MQSKGVLIGAGYMDWTDRGTGETVQRPKVALSGGVVTALPDLYDAEPDALKAAQGLPFGVAVVADFAKNRFNQLILKSIRTA